MSAMIADVRLEQPERVGHREHHRGGLVVERLPQRLEVDVAVALDGIVTVSSSRPALHARGIRAVRRVGHDHLAASVALAARAMVGADHQQPGHLALRARRRLRRDGREAGDRGEQALQLVDHAQRALRGLVGRQRVRRGEARQRAISSLIFGLCFIVHEPSG